MGIEHDKEHKKQLKEQGFDLDYKSGYDFPSIDEVKNTDRSPLFLFLCGIAIGILISQFF